MLQAKEKKMGAKAEDIEFDEEDDELRKPEHQLSTFW